MIETINARDGVTEESTLISLHIKGGILYQEI